MQTEQFWKDVLDLYDKPRTASEIQIQKALWWAASLTMASIVYAGFRLYAVREFAIAVVLTAFGLALFCFFASVLYILGPIGGRGLKKTMPAYGPVPVELRINLVETASVPSVAKLVIKANELLRAS